MSLLFSWLKAINRPDSIIAQQHIISLAHDLISTLILFRFKAQHKGKFSSAFQALAGLHTVQTNTIIKAQ